MYSGRRITESNVEVGRDSYAVERIACIARRAPLIKNSVNRNCTEPKKRGEVEIRQFTETFSSLGISLSLSESRSLFRL